jgi:RNA-dependent RNA polymerase
MDFDGRFNRAEYAQNYRSLGFAPSDARMEELYGRSTANTRSGNEFSFKPNRYAIGWVDAEELFHPGFECAHVSSGEQNPSVRKYEKKSSFWFRFHQNQQVVAGELKP